MQIVESENGVELRQVGRNRFGSRDPEGKGRARLGAVSFSGDCDHFRRNICRKIILNSAGKPECRHSGSAA